MGKETADHKLARQLAEELTQEIDLLDEARYDFGDLVVVVRKTGHALLDGEISDES